MGRPRNKLSKGQPRGSRSASGRKRNLADQREESRVTPCDGVMRRRELYRQPANDVGDAEERRSRRGRQETDTCDPIGRAYCAGLLGKGDRAEQLLIAGRKVHSQYWRHYGMPQAPDSLARWQPRIGGGVPDPERDRIIEQALNDALDLVRARGRQVRWAFDQLVIDMQPDSGPQWLDAIVWAHRHGRQAAEKDYGVLRLAIEGLDAIA